MRQLVLLIAYILTTQARGHSADSGERACLRARSHVRWEVENR